MRHLYTGLFYALVPFLYLRLLIKGRKQPGYLQRISERFGYYAKASLSPSITGNFPSISLISACIAFTFRRAGLKIDP